VRLVKGISIIAIFVLMITAIPLNAVGNDALGTEVSDQISITDSRGVTTNLSQPATHVAAFGAFATNTLVDIGNLSQAIIFDSSSAYSKSGISELENYSDDKFIIVNSANKDAIVQKMLGLVDNGTWNKTTDVIFGYGYSYLSTVWSALESYDFHVITFYPNSYVGIVQVVEDIETVVGANHSVSSQMAYVKTYIKDVLDENGVTNESTKVTALYASYSSNTLKLGNNGSVTTDFIIYAGGVNVAEDASKTAPTYTVDFSAILLLNPDFVLLDGYYSGTAADFSSLIGSSSITVYKLDKSWNSYCPDSMSGLWTIACLFYPEYFSGDVPTIPVVPSSPVDLSAVASDGYVTLTWTAPVNDGGADIDYYVVYMNGTQVTTSTSTHANVTNLTNGQSYSFIVAAHNSVGIGSNSTAIDSTPSATLKVPGAPSGFVATEHDGYVTLTWTAPVNDGGADIDYYVVYMNGTQVTTSTSTHANVTNLTNGQSYSFIVAAHNSVGIGSNSTAIDSTPSATSNDEPSDSSNDLLIYAGVGVCFIIAVVGASLILRGRGKKD
jgi:ABC-type Fe3+-hydroxamate transport system substrate-binding protein